MSLRAAAERLLELDKLKDSQSEMDGIANRFFCIEEMVQIAPQVAKALLEAVDIVRMTKAFIQIEVQARPQHLFDSINKFLQSLEEEKSG